VGATQRQRHPTTPLLCIQLLLPESRQRLTSWLQRYAALPEQTDSTTAQPSLQDSHQRQPKAGHHDYDMDHHGDEPGSGSACSNAGRFWQGFPVVCAADVCYGLMGAACLTPGVITLLLNLVRSVDAASLPAAELALLPHWARQYLADAGHELYEVPLPPGHMWGHSMAVITK
jgi:hypothetical protein